MDLYVQIYQEGMAQGTKDSKTCDELNRRACTAERLRDEAKMKLDAAENEMKRLEMTWECYGAPAETELHIHFVSRGMHAHSQTIENQLNVIKVIDS